MFYYIEPNLRSISDNILHLLHGNVTEHSYEFQKSSKIVFSSEKTSPHVYRFQDSVHKKTNMHSEPSIWTPVDAEVNAGSLLNEAIIAGLSGSQWQQFSIFPSKPCHF